MVRLEDRDAGDFDRLVNATLPALSRYALRRAATATDAEDVVAEVYAIAWRKCQDIPAGDQALLWLYGVARRVLANSRRGGRRWDRLKSKIGGQRVAAPEAPDGFVDRQPVLDALGRLPTRDAEVLRLLTWEQLSQAEAAAALGLSENAVALRASRARKRLAELLDESEIDDRSSPLEDMEGRANLRRSDGN